MGTIDSKVIHAIHFAAQQHSGQTRKGDSQTPYINHPIRVVSVLVEHQEHDTDLLSAAALHDVIEDTVSNEHEMQKLSEEIRNAFGKGVLRIIQEVSDDKSLPFHDRKHLQVVNTPNLSAEAKKIKIADKICNITDMMADPPQGWSSERKKNYLEWAGRVIEGAKGVNKQLENTFEETKQKAYQRIQ